MYFFESKKVKIMVMDNEEQALQRKSAQSISWTASEFANNYKNIMWYFGVLVFLVAISGLIFLVAGDWVASVAILVAGLLFLVMAAKKPRSLQYAINERGLNVGEKFYEFSRFKSFDLTHSNGISNIDLIPTKRFATEISIFLPPDQGQAILSIISDHLPHDEKASNKIDEWTKKLKF